MFKQILMGASAALAAAAIPATSAFAATSGDLEGRMRVPYACSIATPDVLNLEPVTGTPNIATVSDKWEFSHNDDTTYTMTSLDIQKSNNYANLTGSIILNGGSDQIAMLTQESESASVSASMTGADGNYATEARTTESAPDVIIRLNETVAPVFWAGDYRIISTVSCGQNTERGTLF